MHRIIPYIYGGIRGVQEFEIQLDISPDIARSFLEFSSFKQSNVEF